MSDSTLKVIHLTGGLQMIGETSGKVLQGERTFLIVILVEKEGNQTRSIHVNPDHIVAILPCAKEDISSLNTSVNDQWFLEKPAPRRGYKIASHSG
jgi:hypothetical protein